VLDQFDQTRGHGPGLYRFKWEIRGRAMSPTAVEWRYNA
jgi:hypothetical protein